MEKLTDFRLPEVLGLFDGVHADEVMYYLYLPIHRPGEPGVQIPDARLQFLLPLVQAVFRDEPRRCRDEWMYLTVKKMFVGGGVTANRPGWHCDGFLSDDLNYVWSDCVPTIFTTGKFSITPDHLLSLQEFEEQACVFDEITYPPCTLLRLDDRVVHCVDTNVPQQLMRTFVKITLSKNRFNLKDNSRNPLLPDDGPMYDRAMARNDPHQAQSDFYRREPEDDHFK